MLYCLVRLNKKYNWELVATDAVEPNRYLTDDLDWIEKFKNEMAMAYPTEVYNIAEVILPAVDETFQKTYLECPRKFE